ncbi:MAG: hypothetical protein IJR14_04430 [Synergistaceae bacterium]|nr:hypothetical protein [Synergistaceae bacterium]
MASKAKGVTSKRATRKGTTERKGKSKGNVARVYLKLVDGEIDLVADRPIEGADRVIWGFDFKALRKELMKARKARKAAGKARAL